MAVCSTTKWARNTCATSRNDGLSNGWFLKVYLEEARSEPPRLFCIVYSIPILCYYEAMSQTRKKLIPEQKLQKVLAGIRAYEPDKAVLFGSYARGDADEFSDLDVIVIKRTRKRFIDRAVELCELIRPTFALDVLIYTPQEIEQMLGEGNSFLETALSEGKVIYERPEERGR